MVNQTSIKYISGLLENPASLSDGDQSSIALFRQTFPYFAPIRYLAALDHHRKEPMSPAILSGTTPYIGNWMLFCDFLAEGSSSGVIETTIDHTPLDIPTTPTIIEEEVSTPIEEPVILIEEEPAVIRTEPVAEIIPPAPIEQIETEQPNELEESLSNSNIITNQAEPEIRLSRKQRRQAAYLEQRRLALEQHQVKNEVTQEIKNPAASIKNLSDSIINITPPAIVDDAKSLTEEVAINTEQIKVELPDFVLPETPQLSNLQLQLDQRAIEIGSHSIEPSITPSFAAEPISYPDTHFSTPDLIIGSAQNTVQEIVLGNQELENLETTAPGGIIVVPAENWDEVKTNLIKEEAANETEEFNTTESVATPEVPELTIDEPKKQIEAVEDTIRPLFTIRPGKISMNELKDELPATSSEEPVGQSFQILPTKINIREEDTQTEITKNELIVAPEEKPSIVPEVTKEKERESTLIEKLLGEIENITPEQELLIRVITGKPLPEQTPVAEIVPEPELVQVAEPVNEVSEVTNTQEPVIETVPEPISEITPEPVAELTIDIVSEPEQVVMEETTPVIATTEITASHFPEDKQAPKAADEDDGLGTLIYPVYTEDYFLQQGVKISKEIPKDLTHAKDREKSLMVMMSFTEWLLHFKNTSDKQKEEKKDQKSLKTMWQKEKLAAAMEEENEEIPENVFEMAVNSITREDGLASESLADIYIKQKKYDQAIEMYRKLSLRNPKKMRTLPAK